ncbi:MAG: hypothetical protein JWN73_4799 [Betaproteobacteria bacterium]|nr:hypothetical protein [Betaproteobacteria bacterium]
MNQNARLPVFVIVFSLATVIAYVVAVIYNYALFTYHPATGEFGLGVEKARDAPAMYWYGWIATSTITGAVAGLIACALPQGLTRRLPAALAWLAPLIATLVLGYLLRNFFLH